jgi:signal transduction histidine kinase
MFNLFAQLVALELDSQNKRAAVQRALLAERSAGELREQFIGVLGHDLRNPLSAIAACGQLVRLRAGDADAVRSLSFKIDTNVKRMARMIEDITDFARGRLDGGNNVAAEAVDDLDESLTQVVTELRDAHPHRSIDAMVDIGAVVRCDRGRLQQLLSNLLANALTHGGKDGRVSVTAISDGGDLVIEVWNDGEPIPEAMLGKIFGPYWRGHASQRGGLGLGLHICNQIAMAHGGRIEVKSSAADGTTFTARLPIVARD